MGLKDGFNKDYTFQMQFWSTCHLLTAFWQSPSNPDELREAVFTGISRLTYLIVLAPEGLRISHEV